MAYTSIHLGEALRLATLNPDHCFSVVDFEVGFTHAAIVKGAPDKLFSNLGPPPIFRPKAKAWQWRKSPGPSQTWQS